MAPILRRNYLDTSPPTQLTGNIGTTDVSLQVASTAGYPPVPFTLGIDRGTANQEVTFCTSVPDSSHFLVQRNFDGTQAYSHQATATVELVVCSLDYTEANLHHSDITRDDHYQYLTWQGANPRHQSPALHLPNTTIAVGIPTVSNPGDVASMGQNTDTAFALSTHLHGREVAVSALPVGIILDYAGQATLPDPDWMACVGQALSRSVYTTLFAVIGTIYGVGDGSTTFNIPDLRGTFVMGSSFYYPIGVKGGASSITLTDYELPTHSHVIPDPGHYHQSTDNQDFVTGPNVPGGGNYHFADTGPVQAGYDFDVNSAQTGISATGITTTYSIGNGQAFASLPPYLAMQKIIKIA